MKMIYCTCNVSVFEPLIHLLESKGATDYQAIEQMVAKNSFGLHRLNNAVWPGYNSGVLIQVQTEEEAKELIQAIREFNEGAYNDSEKVVACSWTLDDYL